MKLILISIGILLMQMTGWIPPEDQNPEDLTPEEIADEMIREYDFSELNRQLQSVSGLETMNFEDLTELLLQGDIGINSGNIKGIGQLLYRWFLSELDANRFVMVKLFALAVFMAVFTNLNSASSQAGVSENGFYVTYLVMSVLLLAAYQTMYDLAYTAFEDLLKIMSALVPVYITAVGYSSGITSATVMEDSLILGMTLISEAVRRWIMPVIHLYFALGMMDQLMKRDFFSRLSDLLSVSVSWILKSILALTVGLNTIKSMLAPAVDSVTAAAFQRGLQIIPGGDTAAMMSGVVIGSSVLIKNAIGAGGMCVLVMAVSTPVLKLTVIVFMYKMLEAMLQPVADVRMIKGLQVVDRSGQMLLSVLLAEIVLFLLSIAVIAGHTNMNYYVG
ncbi:MAG: stage III sporulation protein AE [Lachnospiraceae bacterium]|nr:stage III sporulation protein AE [Lachnospiraceae bacterium]